MGNFLSSANDAPNDAYQVVLILFCSPFCFFSYFVCFLLFNVLSTVNDNE